MYNSRPRYDRFSNPVNLPENYSGNAFSIGQKESVPEVDEEVEPKDIPSESEIREEKKEEIPVLPRAERFKLDVGRLFHGGIGVEELLIIGLILLIAQSENNDDIILLLALLLFIK